MENNAPHPMQSPIMTEVRNVISECVSAANGSQGAGTEHTTDDNCICNIINLLQQVSEHHRERKQQKCF